MTPCAWLLDACVPLQRTTYLYSQASSQLSFAEWERHSPWLTVDLWTPIISCMACLLSGSSDTLQVRLRSRRPFVPAARNLLDNLARLGIRASEWTNHKWKTEYCENASRLRAFVPEAGARPVAMSLPRAGCVKLNRPRTGVGRFHSCMHKWGLAPSPNCECGASEQTADYVLTACPIHRAPHGVRGLTVLDDET